MKMLEMLQCNIQYKNFEASIAKGYFENTVDLIFHGKNGVYRVDSMKVNRRWSKESFVNHVLNKVSTWWSCLTPENLESLPTIIIFPDTVPPNRPVVLPVSDDNIVVMSVAPVIVFPVTFAISQ